MRLRVHEERSGGPLRSARINILQGEELLLSVRKEEAAPFYLSYGTSSSDFEWDVCNIPGKGNYVTAEKLLYDGRIDYFVLRAPVELSEKIKNKLGKHLNIEEVREVAL